MKSLIGNLREVDIKRLRIYMTIVENGGFVQAQNVLNLSASTISVRMSELEDKLGLVLCQRGRAGFSITAEGDAVYEACQTLLGAHENFNTAINAAKGIICRELKLGVIDNVIFDPDLPVSQAMTKFCEQATNPQISLYTMVPSDLERAVLDQRLHMAIGVFYDKSSAIEYRHICMERLVLYCSKTHPLFNVEGNVSIKEILACQYVERTYGLTISRLNKSIPLTPAAYSSSLEATALLLLTGHYIGFLPRYYANIWCDKGLLKPLNENEIFVESEVSIATNRSTKNSLTTRKLMELFLSCFDN